MTEQEKASTPPRLRVLVADDDRDLVLMLMTVLRDEGHDTRGLYRGEAVMDVVRGYDPDVALLDIGLPGVTGYELARLIRAQHEKRPLLVAITGWTKASDRFAAQLSGFDHHLPKPFAPQAVLDLMRPLAPAHAR